MNKESELVRVNKLLTSFGVCSRREADKLIENKRVKADGKIVEMGEKISPNAKILIDDKPIKREEKRIYIALNKPIGITCTTDRKIKGNIVDFVGHEKRIFNIGRLDKPSQGLILMTNDGEIVNKILRATNNHEKEYLVTVNKPITQEFIKKMSSGVPILDTVTKKCKVRQVAKYTFNIVLTQGLNRQIRRMCEYLGYRVERLERTRIMNINLGNLKTGEWRYLTQREIETLDKLTAGSTKNFKAK